MTGEESEEATSVRFSDNFIPGQYRLIELPQELLAEWEEHQQNAESSSGTFCPD